MPSVNYDKISWNFISETDGSGILEEFWKNSKAIYFFPVEIVQKIWEEEFLEQIALAKDR